MHVACPAIHETPTTITKRRISNIKCRNNDKNRMSQTPKMEPIPGPSALGFRHSFVLRHSCFVISQVQSPCPGHGASECDASAHARAHHSREKMRSKSS